MYRGGGRPGSDAIRGVEPGRRMASVRGKTESSGDAEGRTGRAGRGAMLLRAFSRWRHERRVGWFRIWPGD
jgi:hypothetical protein